VVQDESPPSNNAMQNIAVVIGLFIRIIISKVLVLSVKVTLTSKRKD